MTALAIILAVFATLVVMGFRAARVDWRGPSVNWIDGLVRLLSKYVHKLPDTHIALPETGPAIVVANHVSGLDPFLLISASRRPLRFLIAREQYQMPVLHWLFRAAGCIPVDRSSRPEQALRQALRALQAGEVVALFPHGKIHLDSDPPKKIKGGVARLSVWAEAPIYPVRIDGVAGEDKVVTAPFIPSEVSLTLGEPINCSQDDLKQCLDRITKAISSQPQ